jgi:hypothetical protein
MRRNTDQQGGTHQRRERSTACFDVRLCKNRACRISSSLCIEVHFQSFSDSSTLHTHKRSYKDVIKTASTRCRTELWWTIWKTTCELYNKTTLLGRQQDMYQELIFLSHRIRGTWDFPESDLPYTIDIFAESSNPLSILPWTRTLVLSTKRGRSSSFDAEHFDDDHQDDLIRKKTKKQKR